MYKIMQKSIKYLKYAKLKGKKIKKLPNKNKTFKDVEVQAA